VPIEKKKRPPVSPITTVLFDLDDTLVDSLEPRVQALQYVFSKTHIQNSPAAEFLNSLRGSPLKNALEKLQAEQNVNDDLFGSYRRAYWLGESARIRLYPGIREMLEELHSRRVVLGIVTQKGRDFYFEGHRVGAVKELEQLGILGLFSTVIGFEDVSEQKPHPHCINLALGNVGIRPQNALVVGDSAADIKAARSAGCRSCHATWGITPDSVDTESLSADFVAPAPDDVICIITGTT